MAEKVKLFIKISEVTGMKETDELDTIKSIDCKVKNVDSLMENLWQIVTELDRVKVKLGNKERQLIVEDIPSVVVEELNIEIRRANNTVTDNPKSPEYWHSKYDQDILLIYNGIDKNMKDCSWCVEATIASAIENYLAMNSLEVNSIDELACKIVLARPYKR